MNHEVKSVGAISLRRYLLIGILLPVGLLVIMNTVGLYQQAFSAINTAYDRTLLASAKSIGEQLDVTGYDEQSELRVTVPYAALEAFEADNQSRLFYRVSSLGGDMVSGFRELPFWRGRIQARPPYAALVDFYDDVYQGEAGPRGGAAAARCQRHGTRHGRHPGGRNPGAAHHAGAQDTGLTRCGARPCCWP